MFGEKTYVRSTAEVWHGVCAEPFDQGDWGEGVAIIMDQIPEVNRGICKSLCMNWVAYHALDTEGSFTEFARQAGPRRGGRRGAGDFTGVSMALNQLDYGKALDRVPRGARQAAKDYFTDTFLAKRGIERQMNRANAREYLSPSRVKQGGPWRVVNTAFGRELATSIVGSHAAGDWSYKIISLHGSAGGHAIAAFVGADAVFFDPNYGIFYFEQANNFRLWFGEPGGFYWASRYEKYLGEDFVIRSYAKGISRRGV